LLAAARLFLVLGSWLRPLPSDLCLLTSAFCLLPWRVRSSLRLTHVLFLDDIYKVMFSRFIEQRLRSQLAKPFVHILFGARQTGKSSLIRALIPDPSLVYDFSNPAERTRILADPGAFVRECQALAKGREKGRSGMLLDSQAPSIMMFS
jgi:hypothetical protein